MRSARRSSRDWEATILERALETFGRDGFGVPMAQLIEESGAPTGTYYRLFPDKAAVFARLLDDLHPLFIQRVQARVPDGSPSLRLGMTVATMVELALTEYSEVARLYLRDVRGAGAAHDAAQQADERERVLLGRLIDEGVALGELDCADAAIAAIAISGMVRKVVEAYVVDDRRRPSRRKAAALMGELAVRAAGGNP